MCHLNLKLIPINGQYQTKNYFPKKFKCVIDELELFHII